MTDEKKLKTELSTDNATASSDITTKWTAPKEAALNEWLNREKFSYDVNDDALYNQYADKFKLGGRMAMMDTMGQAQTMTGGYGNSYAQSVGQQTYQGYMQQLNDVIPELYSLAYGMYTDEGDLLLNKYNALAELDQQEYSKAIDKRNYDYQLGRDAVEDEQWKTQNDQAERANLLTEAQAAASLGDFSKLKALGYDTTKAEAAYNASSSGGSGDDGGEDYKLSADEWNDISSRCDEYIMNEDATGLKNYLKGLYNRGYITADEYADFYEKFVPEVKYDGAGGAHGYNVLTAKESKFSPTAKW